MTDMEREALQALGEQLLHLQIAVITRITSDTTVDLVYRSSISAGIRAVEEAIQVFKGPQ